MSSRFNQYTIQPKGAEISSPQPTRAEISSPQPNIDLLIKEVSTTFELFRLTDMPDGQDFQQFMLMRLENDPNPFVIEFSVSAALEPSQLDHCLKHRIRGIFFDYFKMHVTVDVAFECSGSNYSVKFTLGRPPSDTALLELAAALKPWYETMTARGLGDSSPRAPADNTEYLSRALYVDEDEEDPRMMI